jgi:hypothetical protein
MHPWLPLTVFSQSGESAVDPGTLTERAMDPELRIRTPVDPPDARHETTDQRAQAQRASIRPAARWSLPTGQIGTPIRKRPIDGPAYSITS